MRHKVAWILSVLSMASCAAPSAEEPLLVALAALEPDVDCVVSSDAPMITTGLFDVAAGEHRANSYNINLLVESHAIRPKQPTVGTDCTPNVTRITEAVISLLNEDDSLIDLGPMPNPFTVFTFATAPPSESNEPGRGIALIEAIPSAYRPYLRAHAQAGREVTAAIELSGETTGRLAISSAPFRMPIQLCNGCLTHCASTLTQDDIDTLTNGRCPDNSGTNGRVCIDQGC